MVGRRVGGGLIGGLLMGGSLLFISFCYFDNEIETMVEERERRDEREQGDIPRTFAGRESIST
jgi:hypothetical protein